MSRRGSNGFRDHQVRYDVGALEQRVYGLEQSIQNVSAQIGALSSKIDERSRTPWQVIWGAAGVVVLVLGLIGGILYRPIEANVSRLESEQAEDRKAMTIAIQNIGEKFVTVRELDARTARGQTDFARINQDIRQMEQAMVPRAEMTERWRAQDRDIANLQAQVDRIRMDFGSSYSLKDALARMEREIESIKAKERSP